METGAAGYGLPLKCPKCPSKSYYGCLKFSGSRTMKCSRHPAVYELARSYESGPSLCRVKVGREFCNEEMRSVKAECPNCRTRLEAAKPRR